MYDLTSDLWFFRPVTKVKYIQKCKAPFNFKHMELFQIFQVMWGLEGLRDMIFW